MSPLATISLGPLDSPAMRRKRLELPAGKDVLIFNDKDTGKTQGTADYIADFSSRAGDKIDL